MIQFTPYFYAFLGGVLPALIWLAFWLREDAKNPEPKKLIIRTFVLGMLSVILVLPMQQYTANFWPGLTVGTLLVWAGLEEGVKLLAGWLGGLSTQEDNEPLDPLIYMITAALGFVALENALFLAGPILGQDTVGSILTANLRFIGASPLHILSSAIIGGTLAMTFYRSKSTRLVWLLAGFAVAAIVHTGFNVFVSKAEGSGIGAAFGLVWVGVIGLLLMFEKVKTIKPKKRL